MIRYDDTTRMLEASLTLRSKRQDLLTSNIANADTPHYRASDLGFEGFLKNATDADSLSNVETAEFIDTNGGVTEVEAPFDTLDGNTVNRDAEIGKSAENLQRFGVALETVRRKMGLLRYAITGSDAA
ncbi:MAG: flagellar basal body rod protein FlgB [Myxococcales bacterium]|nr:flagellar basal body rod protein FlgB [Myxococcales bacterium]